MRIMPKARYKIPNCNKPGLMATSLPLGHIPLLVETSGMLRVPSPVAHESTLTLEADIDRVGPGVSPTRRCVQCC